MVTVAATAAAVASAKVALALATTIAKTFRGAAAVEDQPHLCVFDGAKSKEHACRI